MSAVCDHCKTPLNDGRFHCRTCHQSHEVGRHGWVAVESPFDPEHRLPRTPIPCPACLVRIGRSAAPEYERQRAGGGR